MLFIKYAEGNLLSECILRREISNEFYQSGKWCQGDFEADDGASCQAVLFVVCYKYESSKLSNHFLLTPGKRGSGEPSQPDPAIRGRVDSNRRGRSAAGFFIFTGNGLLGDVQGPLEDRTDAL